MSTKVVAVIGMTAMIGACSLQPKYTRPAPPIPAVTPSGSAYGIEDDDTVAVSRLSYNEVIQDERLRWIISRGLVESRDLRIALSNVDIARAQYGISRFQRLPSVTAGAGGAFGESSSSSASGGGRVENYTADVSISSFEIDLFGRVKSLSVAAFNEFLATREGAHAANLTLVTEISNAYLSLAADRSLLQIANDALRISEQALRIADARHTAGAASLLDVRQAETSVAQAKADIANLEMRVAQDINALNLLVGEPVNADVLPAKLDDVASLVGDPLRGSSSSQLSTSVLLRRPDVLRAEYQLRAANARIGAARAAFLPRISLSALAGFASGSFNSLFEGANSLWNVGPSVRATLFDGSLKGGIALTNAQRDLLVAQYERAIQVSFREAGDALARRGTIDAALAASQARVDAAADTYNLAVARYKSGLDAFIVTLDAQRQLYIAQQALISVQLARASNMVTLYKVLGGDSDFVGQSKR